MERNEENISSQRYFLSRAVIPSVIFAGLLSLIAPKAVEYMVKSRDERSTGNRMPEKAPLVEQRGYLVEGTNSFYRR